MTLARIHLRLVGAILAMAVTFACASGAVQHQVAAYGAQATTLGLQAQKLIVSQPNDDVTAKAQIAFKALGGGLQRLADALTTYDSLEPAAQATETPKVEALLQEARRLTRSVLVAAGGHEALGQQLVQLFDNLDAIFLEITRAMRPVAAR